MSLVKDYTAEDLQNAFDKGRATGREEALAQPEQHQGPVIVRDKDNVCYQYTSLPQHKQEPVNDWPQVLLDAPVVAGTCGYSFDAMRVTQPQHKPLTDEQKLNLVTNWFAEDWAIKKALGLLSDYDYEAAHGIKE